MLRKKIKRAMTVVMICSVLLASFSACGNETPGAEKKICPAVVILPMFEIGEMTGDDPGEAQRYYEAYFSDPDIYDITEDPFRCRLYVENDVGMCLLGQGKSSAAVNITALLCDERFDFSDTVFLVTGCAGSAKDFGVVGDVYIITAAVDYEIGHTADVRELADESDPLWYRIGEYDAIGYHLLNQDLADRAYALAADIELQTTQSAQACMARNFDGADWAIREPKVLRGTSLTADNYWKGEYNHQKAVYMSETYRTPDPYAATVMEDAAIALAFEKMGMQDQLLIIRASVNMDVFLDGQTPESLWAGAEPMFDNGFDGFDDIFPAAMDNCFRVGKTVIEAIREDKL